MMDGKEWEDDGWMDGGEVMRKGLNGTGKREEGAELKEIDLSGIVNGKQDGYCHDSVRVRRRGSN
jgi:hypothetical protein